MKNKLTEAEIEKLLETDEMAIAFRARIIKIEQLLGKTYSDRIREEYRMYVDDKYRSK